MCVCVCVNVCVCACVCVCMYVCKGVCVCVCLSLAHVHVYTLFSFVFSFFFSLFFGLTTYIEKNMVHSHVNKLESETVRDPEHFCQITKEKLQRFLDVTHKRKTDTRTEYASNVKIKP